MRINRRQFVATSALATVAAPSLFASSGAADRRAKKGCCTVTRDGSNWRTKITSLNANWFYSWGPTMPEGVPPEVAFCPMVWGGRKQQVERLCQEIGPLVQQDQVQYVMGFNEPDQPKQSNLTVAQAIESWPLLMELNAPLVSPGCVHPDREWMKEFMAKVERRNLRVDYVSVHSYGGPSVEGLMKRLENVYKMFGRPLWITEFAVGDWTAKTVNDNKHSPQRIARFMIELLPELEKANFVDRYSWFSAAPSNPKLGTSALFDDQGNLTRLGEIYSGYYTA